MKNVHLENPFFISEYWQTGLADNPYSAKILKSENPSSLEETSIYFSSEFCKKPFLPIPDLRHLLLMKISKKYEEATH